MVYRCVCGCLNFLFNLIYYVFFKCALGSNSLNYVLGCPSFISGFESRSESEWYSEQNRCQWAGSSLGMSIVDCNV